MKKEPYLPINFTISSKGWAEIDNIRRLYDSRQEDKADVLMISWGRTVLNGGRSWSHVIVGFYGTSERYKIRQEIQILSGHEVVFFTTPEFYGKFEGKIIEFDQDKGFFLAPE